MVIQKRSSATSHINSNPKRWLTLANGIYDACYHHCNGCDDPGYAWDNCALTAGPGKREGVECDAVRMRNWEQEGRYPGLCLWELGDVLRERELGKVRFGMLGWLWLVVLTALAGLMGTWLVYHVVKGLTWGCERRVRDRRDEMRGWPGVEGEFTGDEVQTEEQSAGGVEPERGVGGGCWGW
ncbi:hypothetical protein B0T14DRAFT_582962 [Immersiella caudata]|uniref:Uncharacterized protein n=1 Tax=Immersiella caudata TaxID=314043 RepID=A0AA39WYE8_9PEZI|nr:hypothetical protein B0T14DRAFT_582962 [Immersiella caudata]